MDHTAAVPPKLKAEPGTPADEWATKTASALGNPESAIPDPLSPTTKDLLNPTSNNTLPSSSQHTGLALPQSSLSTPAHELPGAYPTSGTPFVDDKQGFVDTAQNVMQNVSETAVHATAVAAAYISSYLPGAANGTVAASEHDIRHKVSLPTKETAGAGSHEHVAGVGALPGSNDESAVARLPADTDNVASSAASNNNFGAHAAPSSLPSEEVKGNEGMGATAGVGALPGHLGESGVAVLPDERPPSLHDRPGVRDHPGGVGDLPGTPNETGVVVLPGERSMDGSREQPPQQGFEDSPTGMKRNGAALFAPSFAQGADQRARQAAERDMRRPAENPGACTFGIRQDHRDTNVKELGVTEHSDTTRQDVREEDTSETTARGENRDADAQNKHAPESQQVSKSSHEDADRHAAENESGYHPAALHPKNADYSHVPVHTSADAAATPDPGHEGERVESGAGDKSEEKHEKTKKSGFVTRMKGEAKMLLGKMEGKHGHGKIAEGERMKAGESPSEPRT